MPILMFPVGMVIHMHPLVLVQAMQTAAALLLPMTSGIVTPEIRVLETSILVVKPT
jgi:hypothetical protein